MCGLTGFARNPKQAQDDTVMVKMIFEELLVRAMSRGRHATGISAHDDQGKGFIWKIAMQATDAIKLDAWKARMAAVTPATAIMIGHTRHATQNNARRDDCAHPFKYKDLTGAHNGMIYNWRELEAKVKPTKPWDVDSMAIFDMLSRTKKPERVLDKFDGYWALTWQQHGLLHFCKTDDAQLAAAYVPALMTLFWHSNIRDLEDILKQTAQKFEAWEVKPNRIYTYDPTMFDQGGTHPKRVDVVFSARRGKRFNTAATDERALRNWPATTGSTNAKGWKTTSEVIAEANRDGNQGTLNLPMTMGELAVEVRTLRAAHHAMIERIRDLENWQADAQQELEYWREVFGTDDLPSCDTNSGECIECGKPGASVSHPDGWIHDECILPTASPYRPGDAPEAEHVTQAERVRVTT